MDFIKDILSKIWQAILNYLYLIMLIGSGIYFSIYLTIIFNSEPNFEATNSYKVLSVLKDLAVIVFSAGIFTASLKFLAYIKVFETEFEKMFKKNDYGGKIESAIQSITLSKEYFAKQLNIKNIWKDITLCMYQETFPELHDKIADVLDNDYFNNLSYYYKDEKVRFTFTPVDEDYIKIEQSVVYVLKRPNKEPFEWQFRFSHLNNNDFPRELSIEFMDNPAVYDPKKHLTESLIGLDQITKTIKVTLSGQTEYRIKRKLVEVQNYKLDRFYAFQNAKIVDNLHVTIKHHRDLNVIFTESNLTQKFTLDENKLLTKSYMSNQVILPGEQFKLFLLKV